MSIARLMQQAAAGNAGGELLAIEDVFSTYLYTGNGSTQTITNGIDLAGEGGLVWTKLRTDAFSHVLIDTERGGTGACVLSSNLTNAAYSGNQTNLITPFNSNGYTIATDWSELNSGTAGRNYASWTFRKAPRFFDVVTYTGTGSARTVSHNLGLVPGCIMVKRTDSTGDWIVYHRSNTANPETDYLELNDTAATADDNTMWNDTAPTDSVFTVGTDNDVNANTATYVAYLFAHDPLGPSGDGSDGLIACGSYTGTGAVGNFVDLGWEPQCLIIKSASATYNWHIFDNMRGITGTGNATLYPNLTNAEANAVPIQVNSTGFTIQTTGAAINQNTGTYIYIAIRRGPMRQPTSGTEVFAIDTQSQSSAPFAISNFPVDLGIRKDVDGSSTDVFTRMLGANLLTANTTNAITSDNVAYFDYMDGYLKSTTQDNTRYNWMFRRAPNFFDVVAYTGTGVARTVHHNLGVAPEMIWVKGRSYAEGWPVYHTGTGNTDYTRINTTGSSVPSSAYWNNTTPTETEFTVGTVDRVNFSGATYIAYLFATLPGVSKVGSYTGNGTSQTIDCGFTSGARFVLIKRTDSTGDWLVGDTARGIVAGNDPYLELNTTAAEDTDEDWLDPDSSGFVVNETSTANANVNTATYIYLAIA